MFLILGISTVNVCFAQSDSISIDYFIGGGFVMGNISNMAGLKLPAVNINVLKAGDSTSLTAGHQIYVEAEPPDGASIMISSEPVIIQNQVSKNIFTANISNDRGGYSIVIIQKVGNRIIELPGRIPTVSGI